MLLCRLASVLWKKEAVGRKEGGREGNRRGIRRREETKTRERHAGRCDHVC